MTYANATRRIGVVALTLLLAIYASSINVSADGETDAYAGGAVDEYSQAGANQAPVMWSGETDAAGEANARDNSDENIQQILVIASGETDAYAGGAIDTYPQPRSNQDTMVWSGETDVAGEADLRGGSIGIAAQSLVLAGGETDSYADGANDVYSQPSSNLDAVVWSGETDMAGEADLKGRDVLVAATVEAPRPDRIVNYVDGLGETDMHGGGLPVDSIAVVALNISVVQEPVHIGHVYADVAAGATDQAAGILVVSIDVCETHEMTKTAIV